MMQDYWSAMFINNLERLIWDKNNCHKGRWKRDRDCSAYPCGQGSTLHGRPALEEDHLRP